MEEVYEPDWATEDRVTYTCQVADILAEIAGAGSARRSRRHHWRSGRR